MKILYFLGLVLLCQAAPMGSPPTNVKASVRMDGDKPYFILKWDKPEFVNENLILGWIVIVRTGDVYVNYSTKEDGHKVTEVVAPQAPAKPTTELAQYYVPADKTEFRFDHMQRGVLYEIAVGAKYPNGLGSLSDMQNIAFL